MSTRARGDHDSPYMRPWRPKHPGAAPPRRAGKHPPGAPAGEGGLVLEAAARVVTRGRRSWRRAAGRVAVASLVVVMAAGAYAANRRAGPRVGAYPATPRAWLDAYLSAAVDSPGRVCRLLFAPDLAARYRHTRPGSCLAFFSNVQDSGVRIRRIVQSAGTAVIELRQAHPPRYVWSVVLARHAGGWRAVDLVSGQ